LTALTKKAGQKWQKHSFCLYREPLQWVRKAVVYQVYLRCFSKEGNFKSLKDNIPRLKDLGVTVLYLLPFHPIGVKSRKGALGSPYAIRDYFTIDPACGTLDDLIDLIQTAHQTGLKVTPFIH
jgi:glycosidase